MSFRFHKHYQNISNLCNPISKLNAYIYLKSLIYKFQIYKIGCLSSRLLNKEKQHNSFFSFLHSGDQYMPFDTDSVTYHSNKAR